MEPIVEAGALDAAPDGAELGAAGGVKGGDIGNAGGAEALLHVFTNAGEIAELDVARDELGGDVGFVEEDEAVGLFEIGGELGDEPIRADADGATETGPDVADDAGADLLGEAEGAGGDGEVAGEFAFQLVDGLDLFDRHEGFDDLAQAVVVADVDVGAGLDGDEAGALAAGLGEAGVALHAELFGLEADGDRAGGLGDDGHDDDGLATQLRALLLLDGGEEGIEVDGERAEHGAMVGGEKPLSNGAWSAHSFPPCASRSLRIPTTNFPRICRGG